MTQGAYQTVRLAKGRHDSPDRGACVMELASMLAGDRFTDHPRDVCPVIAGFLRSYNDLLPDGQPDDLYAYASLAVGTTASRSVRLRRARRVLAWGERVPASRRRRRLLVRLQPWDFVLLPAVEAAMCMDPERRRVAVRALLEELCAMGSDPVTTACGVAREPAPAVGQLVPREADAGTSAAVLGRPSGGIGPPVAGFIRWS
jgi:hypothetical protein